MLLFLEHYIDRLDEGLRIELVHIFLAAFRSNCSEFVLHQLLALGTEVSMVLFIVLPFSHFPVMFLLRSCFAKLLPLESTILVVLLPRLVFALFLSVCDVAESRSLWGVLLLLIRLL